MTNTEQAAAKRADAAADYQKTIRVQATHGALFEALTTVRGLSAWWTDAAGSGATGGELRFSFGSGTCVVQVDEATPTTLVRWTVTECAFEPDWVRTRPTFTITPVDGDMCELQFRHGGLTAELDCIDECTRGWDHFIVSLRNYVETGRGMPRGSSEDDARRG